MSGQLRDDNECQNCGYTVDRAYCSNCGQKNSETRQPFHHLFTHFVEDLTHYDGAFWKTIVHLLFRPGRLTREYLIGKRQTYVPPVKLYIFISFVTFFVLSLTPLNFADRTVAVTQSKTVGRTTADTVKLSDEDNLFGYTSVRELDSVQKYGAEEDKMPGIVYKAVRGAFVANEKGLTKEDLIKQGLQLVPKVLFLYLPLFAFWLWLFHGKKRWYFFDHGIFTLHYFSMLLLLLLIRNLIRIVLTWIFGHDTGIEIAQIIGFLIMLYAFFYFFRAHRRMYGETRFWSYFKSLLLFIINTFFIFVAIMAAIVYFFSSIH